MNKLHHKDFSIAFKTGTDANKSKFKKECVQGEIYHATDTGFFYIAEVTAGASDATLAQFTNTPFNQYSVDLDGSNDYIDCGGDTDFSFTDGANNDSAFSVSAWVKLDTNNRARVVAKGNMEWLFGTDGDNKFSLFLWSESGTAVRLGIRENSVLSTGVWHHLVATYDGSNTVSGINLYRAGNPLTSTNNLSVGNYVGMDSEQGSLRIGVWEVGGAMNGLVDEVAVFDYELNSSQVESLSSADNSKPVDISSLSPIGWWRMGDGSDGSGNNDGTVVGGLPQVYNVATDGSGNRITGIDGSLTNIASPFGIVNGVGDTP